MGRGARIVAGATSAVLLAGFVDASEGAATRGRRPAPGIELQGMFHRAAWEGGVTFRISDSGTHIGQVDGILPGTCRDARTGRRAEAGRDGAIGVLFVAHPDALIRPDGTFAFTARATSDSGYPPHTITVRGAFYGSNVLGRVTGRSGTGDRYSDCRGDEPFWAKRIR